MRHAAWLLTMAAPLIAVAAPVPEPATEPRQATMIQDVVAGESHENGQARWNSVVFSQLSDVCGLTGTDRKIELGKKAGPEPRANAGDCVASSAWIHNNSQRPIYCRVVLKLAQPDDSGRTEITGQRLIAPDGMESLATAYGEEARAPSKAITKCEVSADTPMPPLRPCEFRIISAPDPDLYYPAESRRLEQQGSVILDFQFDSATRKLRDIRVSQSSGYRLLDIAALRLGRKVEATAVCPGKRHKMKVKFRVVIEDPEPLPAPSPAS